MKMMRRNPKLLIAINTIESFWLSLRRKIAIALQSCLVKFIKSKKSKERGRKLKKTKKDRLLYNHFGDNWHNSPPNPSENFPRLQFPIFLRKTSNIAQTVERRTFFQNTLRSTCKRQEENTKCWGEFLQNTLWCTCNWQLSNFHYSKISIYRWLYDDNINFQVVICKS